MKRTDWIFLTSIVLYSILFWKQMFGLNMLIFSGVLLTGQVLLDPRILKIRRWGIAAAGTLCAAFCVFYYGTTLGICATFFSLLLSSYFAWNQKGSVLIGIFSSFISIGASVGFMIARYYEKKTARNPQAKSNRAGKKIMIVCCALLVTLVFFFLYRDSSVLFLNLTQKINFDWISFGWIFFTLAGALIMYGFYFHNSIPGVPEWDAQRPLELRPEKESTWMDKLMSIDSERFSGIVLLSLLNLMLLVVNGLDIAFVAGSDGQLPPGVTRTEYVHQGVGTLITSIILAMLIILFYFRGRMNFSPLGKALRMLALIWILQNAFMLLSTALRNYEYVLGYGLTYKRIGVYFYLLLALIGLIVTAWKVQGKKTNAFLVRTNSWLFYSVWIIACFVNWDSLIIHNNLQKGTKADIAYLNSLSPLILPELIDYSAAHPAEAEKANLTSTVPNRAYLFMNKQAQLRDDNDWPSYVFKNARIYNQLQSYTTIGKNTQLDIGGYGLKAVHYFKAFANITALNVQNNELVTISETAKFPNLQLLDISFNEDLISLAGLEQATKLEFLSMAGTNVTDFSPLLKLKNLKSITLDHMSDEWQRRLHVINPGLEIISH